MSAKRYYPAFLDLTGRLAVIIGPAEGIERKALQLTKYGADVLVIAPSPSTKLLQAEVDGKLSVEARAYVRGDLEGAALALCLTTDDEVRRAVFEEAIREGCPVNAPGSAPRSTFLAPSVIHREPLQIAVSTGGTAPQLAKHLRRMLAQEFGEEWGAFAELFGGVRALALEQLEDSLAADAMLAALIESDVLDRIRSGETVTPEEVYEQLAATQPTSDGEEAEPQA